MMFKGVIFDLDGTLVDSLEDLANSVNGMLSAKGFPEHALNDYRYFVGDGIMMLIKRALPLEYAADGNFVSDCLRIVNEEYMVRWSDRTRPYDGIVRLLSDINKKKIKLAVLSNKPHEFTSLIVPHFFPEIVFDMVLGSREGVPRKPDTTAVCEILQAIDVKAEQCLYVGDSNIDMKTGRGAGMFTVGVSWGFRPEKELRDSGADMIVHSAETIGELLQV
jgi:phosphoglycolate phosphatase